MRRQLPLAARIARAMELRLSPCGVGAAAFLCALRNASYVDEIYYCSIGSGSQNICRQILNTVL
jgi:hypothetical protein